MLGTRAVFVLAISVGLAAGCTSDGTGPASDAIATTPDIAAPSDGPTPPTAPSTVAPPTTAPSATAPLPTPTTPPPTTPPPTTPPPTTTAPTGDDTAEIDRIVAEFVTARGLNGAGLAIVHRDHGVVHEAYWGEFDRDRVSFVASSSKMVSAGVLARLHDDGVLDLDQPIADALAGRAEWTTARPGITTAQLLSNSSGLVGLGPDPTYPPYACQFLPDGTLQECAAAIFTTTDDAGVVVPPDTQFRYGGAQWQVAGAVAEVASGRSWRELVEEIYVRPCGLRAFGYDNHYIRMTPLGFFHPDDFDGDVARMPSTDNPNIEAGLYTTVLDYAAVLLMHLRDGWCDGGRVLSTDALARLHADRTGTVYASPTGYGMGWYVDRATGRLLDPGAWGSVAWLDLEAGHGGFLVLESLWTDGNALAAQLFDPVAELFATAG